MKKAGFTIVEVAISIAILVGIVWVVASFSVNVLNLNQSATQSLSAQLDTRKTMEDIVAELRTATPSATGAFTIESAATNSLVFFANIDSSSTSTERVRYFVDVPTRSLRKGVVVSTSSPPSYLLSSETISTVVSNLVVPTTTPVFDYYDTNYAGTTSPIILPIDVSLIRLIKITIFVDQDPNRPPPVLILSSQVSLRNLKDNL